MIDAIAQLDPASRALLDLSLRRGLRAEDIADVLGADADAVVRMCDGAIAAVAGHIGLSGGDQLDRARSLLAELPSDEWPGAPSNGHNGAAAARFELPTIETALNKVEDAPAGEAADEPQAEEPAARGGADEPQAEEPAARGGADEPRAEEPAARGGADEPQAEEPAALGGAGEPRAEEPAALGDGQASQEAADAAEAAEPAEAVAEPSKVAEGAEQPIDTGTAAEVAEADEQPIEAEDAAEVAEADEPVAEPHQAEKGETASEGAIEAAEAEPATTEQPQTTGHGADATPAESIAAEDTPPAEAAATAEAASPPAEDTAAERVGPDAEEGPGATPTHAGRKVVVGGCLAAAIAAAIAVPLATSGSSSQHPHGVAHRAPAPLPHPASPSAPPGPARTLTPVAGGLRGAHASAQLIAGGSRISMRITGLAPARGGVYEVWLFNSVIDSVPIARFSASVARIDAPLARDARRFREVDVSFQPGGQIAVHSGISVLRVPFGELERR